MRQAVFEKVIRTSFIDTHEHLIKEKARLGDRSMIEKKVMTGPIC